MSKAVQEHLTPGMRQKIYLILLFVSLILLFYSIWQVKPVIVELYAPLGLVSYLTPCYWIGLALLVGTSIFAFLDRELKKDVIFILILIVLGLFLWGVALLVEESPRDASSYFPSSAVRLLLDTHHFNIADYPLVTYFSWPGLHLISASILTVAGIDLSLDFLKYAPLLIMLGFIFITYAIGKRLELSPDRCFLLTFIVLSSWFVTMLGTYTPRTLGVLLLLVLFMLLVRPRRIAAEVVVVMLIFSALVLTHGLTSIAVIAALILLLIYRKETRFILLFITIFGFWYIYQASGALAQGIHQFWTVPFSDILKVAGAERYQTASVVARFVVRYSQLGYLALYAALVMGSAVLFLRRRITEQRRKQVLSLFFWSAGLAFIVSLAYGTEGLYRAYLFILVPAVCITLLSFSSRRLLVAVMCLCVALFLPANYASEAGYPQVLTTELKGAKFLMNTVKPWHSFYYGADPGVMGYYNPNMLTEVSVFSPSWMPARSPGEVDLAFIDASCQYVCLSKQGTDHVVFAWGEDPYALWTQTETGKKADLLYNNGYFQIYKNPNPSFPYEKPE